MKYIASTLLAFALSFSGAAQAEGVTIGIGAPLTGDLATIGADMKAGIELAVADVNAKGGLLGKNMNAVFEDHACDPKAGVTVVNRLIAAKVDAVMSDCSKVCMAVAPLLAEENIPFLHACSSDAVSESGWTNTIRVGLRNAAEAPKIARLLTRDFKGKRFALIYAGEEFNSDLAGKILEVLVQDKAAPDAVHKVAEKTEDFAAIIADLQNRRIETVYLGLWPKAAGLFMRQAAAVRYKPQFIGNFAASTDDVVKIAGHAADGMVFNRQPDPKKIPGAQGVIAALEAKDVRNRPFAVYYYALAQVYAAAVQKAGAADAQAVLATLKSQTFDTVLGPLTFDAKGDMAGFDFEYYQWQNGQAMPWKK